MNPHAQVVAIDGPAAAGKSTVAALLASRLGALLFDTGSLYRAVTLAAIARGIDLDDGAALQDLVETIRIDLHPPSVEDGRLADVLLDGEDVTWAIRAPEVDRNVSAVSAHAEVRHALLPVQRRIASGAPVVMVGRDIGTVVIPEAGVKIFLNASAEERARRRTTEVIARGGEADYATVLAEIKRRDHVDSTRAVSPLEQAADAIVIETDGASAEEAAREIESIVRSRVAMPEPRHGG